MTSTARHPSDLTPGQAVSVWTMHENQPVYRLADGHVRDAGTDTSVAALVELDGPCDLLVCGPADAIAVCPADRPVPLAVIPAGWPLNETATRLVHFGQVGR